MINEILDVLFPTWTPAPKWDPIQNLDSIDLIAEHSTGLIEMVIVVSQPLDGSDKTQKLIEAKIEKYLSEILTETFKSSFPTIRAPSDIKITIDCQSRIHKRSKLTINEFKNKIRESGYLFCLSR
jgi:hypothetical protein